MKDIMNTIKGNISIVAAAASYSSMSPTQRGAVHDAVVYENKINQARCLTGYTYEEAKAKANEIGIDTLIARAKLGIVK